MLQQVCPAVKYLFQSHRTKAEQSLKAMCSTNPLARNNDVCIEDMQFQTHNVLLNNIIAASNGDIVTLHVSGQTK